MVFYVIMILLIVVAVVEVIVYSYSTLKEYKSIEKMEKEAEGKGDEK